MSRAWDRSGQVERDSLQFQLSEAMAQIEELRDYAVFWRDLWGKVMLDRSKKCSGNKDGRAIYNIPLELHDALYIHWRTQPKGLRQRGNG